MSHIGERMHAVLYKHKLLLKQASEYAEIPYRSLQNYISGKQQPGTDALLKFHRAFDVNLNWLLTGEGVQEVEKVNSEPSSYVLNEKLLMQIVEGVEKVLAKKQKILSADKKARVITMLYKTAAKDQSIDPETIKQLIEIAA